MKRIRKLTTAFLVIALLVTSLVSVPALAEEDGKVHRTAGASRYLTAVEVSKKAYKEAETVIIAAGANLNFPDALAASALAGKEEAPILLAEQDGFRAGTLEEIARLGAKKAIVLGGEKALGKEVVDALEDAGLKVTRIAGENRYETAALIAAEVLGTGKEVFLVNGDEPWDALAIGPVAARDGIPVLLTKAGALRAETKAFLVDKGIKTVTILGGDKAVSPAVRAEIPASVSSVKRVHGLNREATAIEIAERFFDDPEAVIIASRDKFADALVGGYFGGLLDAPIMLVYEKKIRENVEEYLWDNQQVGDIYILGGEAVIGKAVVEEIEEIGVVLRVESVSAITTTGVDVEFDALTEDMEDVTIEVIDNNGNVVEVNPLNLVINETIGEFKFKTALTAAPKGIWTVAGIKYDADAAAQLKAINGATTELGLWNALEAAGIKNLVVANSALYKSELPAENFETLVEVQDYVDEVNNSVLDEAATEEVMDEINAALAVPSNVQLLAALKPFARVNEDFVASYNGGATKLGSITITPGTTTMKEVQEEIDKLNVAQVGSLIGIAEGSAKRADYSKALAAMKFVREDDPKATPADTVKADLQERLVELNLIIKVLEAKTAAQFTNAYNALVVYVDDETVLGEDDYYVGLRTEYMAEVVGKANTAGIKAAIIEVNNTKRAELYNALAKYDASNNKDGIIDASDGTETKTAKVLEKLQAFAVYVDKDDFDLETVETTKERLEAYREELVKLTTYKTSSDVMASIGDIQTAVDAGNTAVEAAPLAKFATFDSTTNPTTDTEAALLALLKDAELALGNVVDANSAAYFAEEADIKTEAAKGKDELKALIGDLNQVQVIANATTGAEARAALGYVAIEVATTDFINLTAAQKSEVSALFINDDKFGASAFAGAARQVAKLKEYTKTADVAADLGQITGAYTTVLKEINTKSDSDTIAKMVVKLGALEYKAFDDLTPAEKIDVADAFLANFPLDDKDARIPYTTFGGVQSAIDTAIAAQ